MTVNCGGIPFHFVDDVDLIRATEEHLFIIDDQKRGDKGRQIWKHYHTIKALASVLPMFAKEPGCCARTVGVANPRRASHER